MLFFYLGNDKVSEIQKMRKFRKFFNLEKLSNTWTVQVILKNNDKHKFINKIIE